MAFKKGYIPWNKGKKGISKEYSKHLSEAHQGGTTSKKGKHYPHLQEENHPQWKGDNVSYRRLHMWVVKKKGQPDVCEKCGKAGLKGRQIHWANKSGKYKRDLNDWIRLCQSCHKYFDSSLKGSSSTYNKERKPSCKHSRADSGEQSPSGQS